MNPDTGAIALALAAQGRQALTTGQLDDGRRLLAQAHSLQPDDAELLLDMAVASLMARDTAQALLHAEAAASRGQSWRVSMVLGHVNLGLGRKDQAAADLRSALGCVDLPDAMRGQLLQQQANLLLNGFGDARGAAEVLDLAATANASMRLNAMLGRLVADLYEGSRPSRVIAADFANLGQSLEAKLPVPAQRPPRRQRPRPRIGIVSMQFCASPVAFLTLGALGVMARSADLVLLDRGSKKDWATDRFRQMARAWEDCAALDAQGLRQRLLDADLDVVIDLCGWTDPVVMLVLAGRPVQRQIKWVGGQSLTTGLRCFDGFVTDTRQVPAAAASLYTEPLLYAQHGYVSYVAPPYAPNLARALTRLPRLSGSPSQGVLAIVSNPAKISVTTAKAVRQMRPRRLWLVDQRWRHEGTRAAAARRLGDLMDVAEFITPSNHPEYLQALQDLDARIVDTSPYSMGLTAIELRLLGKHVLTIQRSPTALMCERHCVGHMDARRFDHHAELAHQLLEWCRPS